jgi:hypothetical protein
MTTREEQPTSPTSYLLDDPLAPCTDGQSILDSLLQRGNDVSQTSEIACVDKLSGMSIVQRERTVGFTSAKRGGRSSA